MRQRARKRKAGAAERPGGTIWPIPRTSTHCCSTSSPSAASSVDLYGQQIGSRLEDIASFAKSVGGCPTNIAIGTARLGLQLGADHPRRRRADGPLHPRAAARARASTTTGIATDPERLTALVLLVGRGREASPADLLPRRLRRHGAVRGRHRRGLHRLGARRRRHRHAFLAAEHRRRAAQGDAASPRRHGGKVVFDIDYRPNLWGLAGHAAGEERYIKSDARLGAAARPSCPTAT